MSGTGDDHDTTAFGAPNPVSEQDSDSPFDRARAAGGSFGGGGIEPLTIGQGHPPVYGAGPQPPLSEQTVIGAAPWQGGGSDQQSSGQNVTWIRGAAGPLPSPPAWLAGQPRDEGGVGRPDQPQAGFFPDYYSSRPAANPRLLPRIALQDALRSSHIGAGSASNPLLASAASLLILLGRLRTGMVELQIAPLMEHVTAEIERFQQTAAAAGLDPHEVMVAKYALSGTADDIVQNLPGSDRGSWQQYSMVARFFHKRDSGVGFFQEAEKAMQAPAQRCHLLELMLVCMSLGFEGQFRTAPHGSTELARIRRAIHQTLRRVHPRPDEDISVMWTPVVQDHQRRLVAIPLPVVMGGAGLAVVALFALLTTWINREGAAASANILALHQNTPEIAIQRIASIPYAAPLPQLERIRAALAAELAEGAIQIKAKGNYIAIQVDNLYLFDLGKTDIRPEFNALGMRIAEVLNHEAGPVLVQGFSDNLPLSGRGFYKDNYQLSHARAQSVRDLLAVAFDDSARLQVQGRGEEDPIADNGTPEGRARNRRVEILQAREGTFPDHPPLSEAKL